MPPPASANRLRILLVALAALAVLVFLFLEGREGESPEMASQHPSAAEGSAPGSEEASAFSEPDAGPAAEDFSGANDGRPPGLMESAMADFDARESRSNSQSPGGQALASGTGGDDSRPPRKSSRPSSAPDRSGPSRPGFGRRGIIPPARPPS